MNAKDLMVGDWVSYDGKPVRVNCVASNSIGLEGVESDTICKDNMIEPIPLTSEILEKNGFVKTNDGWECDENDVVTIVLHSEKSCDMWIAEASYEWKHLRYAFPYPKYVHELQHALRLCGIDKEIVVDRYVTEDFLKMKFPACTWQFRYGRQMRNEHFGSDETIWKFPEGVEIQDDKKYRVCYTRRDSADSSDSSTYYTVHFIEEW